MAKKYVPYQKKTPSDLEIKNSLLETLGKNHNTLVKILVLLFQDAHVIEQTLSEIFLEKDRLNVDSEIYEDPIKSKLLLRYALLSVVRTRKIWAEKIWQTIGLSEEIKKLINTEFPLCIKGTAIALESPETTVYYWLTSTKKVEKSEQIALLISKPYSEINDNKKNELSILFNQYEAECNQLKKLQKTIKTKIKYRLVTTPNHGIKRSKLNTRAPIRRQRCKYYSRMEDDDIQALLTPTTPTTPTRPTRPILTTFVPIPTTPTESNSADQEIQIENVVNPLDLLTKSTDDASPIPNLTQLPFLQPKTVSHQAYILYSDFINGSRYPNRDDDTDPECDTSTHSEEDTAILIQPHKRPRMQ